MDQAHCQPRILVADDDPVSLRFLAQGLEDLGCAATAMPNGSAVLDAVARMRYDLLLLDRRMPDLGGVALLRALRDRHIETPAIATSAELDAAQRTELLDAGYVDALTKPITLDGLARAVAACSPDWRGSRAKVMRADSSIATPFTSLSPLDDAAGLVSVGGDAATLHALRGLLAGEIDDLIERLATRPLEPRALGESLHRLRAACLYCGAPLLGVAAARLESAFAQPTPPARVQVEEFIDACARTRAALAAQSSPDSG